jgi:hydrogenase maturation protein HypF
VSGFRPFVYRLAHEEQLTGWVCNDAEGVLLEVQGAPDRVARFRARLQTDAPPLARVLEVQATPCNRLASDGRFSILPSRGGVVKTAIAPDTATCADCLAELFDPADRRHRYGFINCTQCGPRYTITRGLPYDRALTSMAGFIQCPQCQREYTDPAHRRFHAEPNACPACGPQLSWVDARARRCRCPRAMPSLRHWPRCAPARSSPSRAWAAFTSPAMHATRPPWRACASASSAMKSPLR